MTIRFLFANPTAKWKQIGAWFLRVGEMVDAGHFAIQLETFQENVVYESLLPKSQKIPIKEWLTHYKVVKSYEWQVPTHLQFKVKEWLDSKVGIPYAISQIIIIGVCIILKPINAILFNVLFNGEKTMICTEYGSRFIERFMRIRIKESHDKIGLWDMYEYSDRLELNPRWVDE